MTPPFPVRAITTGPKFHFFGYYDKTAWDSSGRFVLALQTTFMDRRPGPDDIATVGMVDLENDNRFVPLAETRAWNWQQGAMLQWVPGTSHEIVFNDRQNGQFVAVVLNTQTGATRILPHPVYAVSPNGRDAISLNFSRLFDVRPGYGYAGVPDPWADEICPDADGLYQVNLQTGEEKLVFSLAQARALGKTQTGMDDGKHRFNHAQFARDESGTRLAVLHRWSADKSVYGVPWGTRLLTLNTDGSDPFVLSDHEMVSHYDWRDGNTLLAWARREGIGNRYFFFTDKSDAPPAVWGEDVFTQDGHCSFSPNKEWVLTDTYPDKTTGNKTLMLFHPATGRRIDIGQFHGPLPSDGEIRTDLHPRWNRDGTQVCIDSIHENGARQMYIVDVESITNA